jgi:putative copper export protein/mono/diheme cytochrome c family protein/peroxiredoxin
VSAFAVAVRWAHLLAASSLVGVFACLLAVARPAARTGGQETALAPLDRALVRFGAWSLALTLASGLLDLWRQTGTATGLGLAGSLTPAALASVLFQTQYGTVWLGRHAVLLFLGVFLLLAEPEREPRDWLGLRLQALALGAASLVLFVAAGHAASAQERPELAMLADASHLLATGVWFGALLPLARVLRWAATLPPPAGPVVAGDATRRFSALGLTSVGLLVVSGLYNAWEQVGGPAPLFGTPYGRWLCLKLLLLLPLVALAAANLLVVKPRLLAAAAAGREPAGRLLGRLRANVGLEALLGTAILGVVAVLGITTPARHDEPVWPFAFRLSWGAATLVPGVQLRVAIGSQVALFGLVALLLALIVRRRGWRWVVVGGLAAIGLGLTVALPPLAVDAYPTTYARPAVTYTATSVVAGQALYLQHCAACHGEAGYGDGPAAAALRPRPADLTAPHTADHTAGDLFWWLTHGIRGSAMPGFADRLSAEARWDVINFLRVLAAAERARDLSPTIDARPRFVAPDFPYTTGVGESRALKDLRGDRVVVLALFTLPGSRERLVALGSVYPSLRLLGAEILAIPREAAGQVYRLLGGVPVFFPIVVDGAEEAAATYAMFGRDRNRDSAPAHVEYLIDRQGYLRGRWSPDDAGGWTDVSRLVAEVTRLVREPALAPLPGEHVH